MLGTVIKSAILGLGELLFGWWERRKQAQKEAERTALKRHVLSREIAVKDEEALRQAMAQEQTREEFDLSRL